MKTIVAFLAREHGLAVFNALLHDSRYRIVQLYTHAHEPKSKDPLRSERPEYAEFVRLCAAHQIPCSAIDRANDQPTSCTPCDFVIEISWRYFIPESLTARARVAAFGIHRGKLPEFAGAEPLQQALLAEEREIILSAHRLSPRIDGGEVLATASHAIVPRPAEPLATQIARLRAEITPLFVRLMQQTLEQLGAVG